MRVSGLFFVLGWTSACSLGNAGIAAFSNPAITGIQCCPPYVKKLALHQAATVRMRFSGWRTQIIHLRSGHKLGLLQVLRSDDVHPGIGRDLHHFQKRSRFCRLDYHVESDIGRVRRPHGTSKAHISRLWVQWLVSSFPRLDIVLHIAVWASLDFVSRRPRRQRRWPAGPVARCKDSHWCRRSSGLFSNCRMLLCYLTISPAARAG